MHTAYLTDLTNTHLEMPLGRICAGTMVVTTCSSRKGEDLVTWACARGNAYGEVGNLCAQDVAAREFRIWRHAQPALYLRAFGPSATIILITGDHRRA